MTFYLFSSDAIACLSFSSTPHLSKATMIPWPVRLPTPPPTTMLTSMKNTRPSSPGIQPRRTPFFWQQSTYFSRKGPTCVSNTSRSLFVSPADLLVRLRPGQALGEEEVDSLASSVVTPLPSSSSHFLSTCPRLRRKTSELNKACLNICLSDFLDDVLSLKKQKSAAATTATRRRARSYTLPSFTCTCVSLQLAVPLLFVRVRE